MLKTKYLKIGLMLLMAFSFSGCVDSISSIGTSEKTIAKVFIKGTVISTVKVMMNDKDLTTLKGVSVEAVESKQENKEEASIFDGAYTNLKNKLVGCDVIAFQTTIFDENEKEYLTFLENELPMNTKVEFLLEDKKIESVFVVSIPNEKPKPKVKKLTVTPKPKPKVKKLTVTPKPKPKVKKTVKRSATVKSKVSSKSSTVVEPKKIDASLGW